MNYNNFTQEMEYNQILCGDVLEQLRTLPDGSVNCVVTSPPYYGLRDYGTGEWEGGDGDCDHIYDRTLGMRASTLGGGKTNQPQGSIYRTCPKCGATRTDRQIGLEETPEEYIAKLVEVFREVKRVLRADGVCWLNLGDSYAGNGEKKTGRNDNGRPEKNRGWAEYDIKQSKIDLSYNLPPKNLLGIPWRVALALQADGWYLRSDVIWAKPNPMPESVTDRPTKSHEYVFLLTKSARYWYDAEAIREPQVTKSLDEAQKRASKGGAQYDKWEDRMILIGDVLEQLRTLPDGSVNCVVTSPPYYGLRDYDEAGQIGLEQTPEEYIAKLVEVFREVKRVLRADGVCWLNLGDSYAASGGHTKSGKSAIVGNTKKGLSNLGSTSIPDGMKSKNLLGIPWRVALALQADGWYLRSDVIWAKPNPMPESVTDRPTKAHEYVFLLTKSARYWYDADAIREPHSRDWWNESVGQKYMTPQQGRNDGGKREGNGNPSGRNARTVWTDDTPAEILSYLAANHPEAYADIADKLSHQSDVFKIATTPYKGAHFAVFPPALVERCILAGCPSRVCVECGEPWVRVVEREASNHKSRSDRQIARGGAISGGVGKNFPDVNIKTLGFTPTCQCNGHFEERTIEDYYDWEEGEDAKQKTIQVYVPHIPLNEHPHQPGVVLDPFFGSGTTGAVAEKLRRRWVGIELNPEYVKLAEARIYQTQPGLPGIF